MSRINFDSLAAETTDDLRPVWSGLKEWFRRHEKTKFIDIRALAHELPEVRTIKLAEALSVMVQHRLLRPIYRVSTPDGNLLDREFSSPSEIPERLPDRFHTGYFDTADGDIVQGFRVETNGAEK